MAFRCVSCDKGTTSGGSMSHSHHFVKRRFKPNLQRIRILWKGRPARRWVCVNCIVSGKVRKAA